MSGLRRRGWWQAATTANTVVQRVHGVKIRLVGQHLGLPELGRDELRVDVVAVLAGNMAAHRVVAGEGAVTVRAGHADALMALANVGPQVGLITVGPFTKRTFQLRT